VNGVYYRVSTQRQGRSGLGLDAQKKAVREYLNGGDWKIKGEFTEVESGKRSDRPQLAAALAACRLHGAQLIRFACGKSTATKSTPASMRLDTNATTRAG
jgi:DNA invertase Pin-like site-specific DNA recombinase